MKYKMPMVIEGKSAVEWIGIAEADIRELTMDVVDARAEIALMHDSLERIAKWTDKIGYTTRAQAIRTFIKGSKERMDDGR